MRLRLGPAPVPMSPMLLVADLAAKLAGLVDAVVSVDCVLRMPGILVGVRQMGPATRSAFDNNNDRWRLRTVFPTRLLARTSLLKFF